MPPTRLGIANSDDRSLLISCVYDEVIKWEVYVIDMEKQNLQKKRKVTADEVCGGVCNGGDITQSDEPFDAKN